MFNTRVDVVELRKEQKDYIIEEIKKFVTEEIGHEIGMFEALDLFEFFTEKIGAIYYNRGLHDAQAVLSKRLDSINEAISDIEKPTVV
jgi:uncharacterized protein (DUF2164 family)